MGFTSAGFCLRGAFTASPRTRVIGSDRAVRWRHRGFAGLFAAVLAAERV